MPLSDKLSHRMRRRRDRPGGSTQLIPLIVQELEPIGGFSGTAFVLPDRTTTTTTRLLNPAA